MTLNEQITQLEREADDMERLEHELGRLGLEVPSGLELPIARAFRIASDRRAKLEQLRGQS